MISAVAIGQDLFARLLCNVTWRKDWNPSTVFGVFAATAAAGRLLCLTREQMANALSIASLQSSGTMEVIYGIGGDLRGMYAGFSAKAALLAVRLAEKGVTGPLTSFEGKAGFLPTYFRGDYDRAKMRQNLGRHYLGSTTLYKPWPAVGTAHSHIHATIQLVTQNGLLANDIEQIRVYVGDNQKIMCTPLETRRAPATLVDAKFSLPFLVALAAVRRNVTISDFTTTGLQDPQVLATAQKVIPAEDATFDWKYELPLGRVEITTKNGRKLDLVGQNVPGSREAPMTWEHIGRKFAECASLAVVAPNTGQIEQVQRMARHLEAVGDATELLRVIG